jgi:hypothetical protein
MKKLLFYLILFPGILGWEVAWAKPPPWAPAHGYRAKYQYYYYPGAQVYFAPDRHQYWYRDAGTWRVGVSLPGSIRLGDKVILDLDTATPYSVHSKVRQYYPKPKP